LRETPPVRVGRRWYGDYPFRTDRELKIPKSVYRLHEELVVSPRVDDLHFDGDELKIGGYAFIAGLGAPTRDSQRVTVTVVRRGRLRRVRMRTSAIQLRARVVHRPEVTASTTQASADAQWSGFEATLPPRKLKALGRWRPGTWDLYVTVRAGGVTRRRSRFLVDSPRPVRAVDCELSDGVLVQASPAITGEIAVHVHDSWARVLSHELGDGLVELRGRMRGTATTLRLARPGEKKLEFPLERRGDSDFVVRVPLADLERAVESADPEPHGSEHSGAMAWNLWTVGEGAPSTRVSLEEHAREASWPVAGRELALIRTKEGDATLLARAPLPVVDEARWTDDGELELSGEGDGVSELLLVGRLHIEQHAFPASMEAGVFSARLTPGRVTSLAGVRPLQEGSWDLYARGPDGLRRVLLTQQLYDRLPLRTVVAHKTFLLGCTPELQAVVLAHRDLDDDGERGRFHQRQLRQGVYAPGREQALREAVVYLSFAGRQFSDSPRAVHEELVRRDSGLDHLWLVSDGRCVVPSTAVALRSGSREYYEAMARSRFVVANGFLPDWFVRRPDQVVVQTLQGTPLKRIGLDVPHLRSTMRRSWRWAEQLASWRYLLSPSPFATPVLQQAFGFEGEVLELGLSRNDLLASPEAVSVMVRTRLGIRDGARVILYAPTYRDHVVDRRGRYRLDQHLDVERVMGALDADSYLLIRKHPLVADAVETAGHAHVLDVSLWRDAGELLATADVLVTDYSSIAFDFALTGRPILFFTYDLDTYRDQIRGFYLDFSATAPGPLLRTNAELIDALRDLDAVHAAHERRYADFVSAFCELDDGHASARVVDRIFAP
jgi:CDP-glycerol glycerophosphotransferase